MATVKGIYGPTELENLLSVAREFVIVQPRAVSGVAFSKSPNLTGTLDRWHNPQQSSISSAVATAWQCAASVVSAVLSVGVVTRGLRY